MAITLKKIDTTIHLFDLRTGNHSFENGRVWSEHDGPAYLGTYLNRDGKAVAVDWPAETAWRSPLLQSALGAGLLDAGVSDLETRKFLFYAAAEAAREEREAAEAREEAWRAEQARLGEVVQQGHFCVEVVSRSGDLAEIFWSRAEAEKAFSRVWCEEGTARLWQGSFERTRAGVVTSRGKKFLVKKEEYWKGWDTDEF